MLRRCRLRVFNFQIFNSAPSGQRQLPFIEHDRPRDRILCRSGRCRRGAFNFQFSIFNSARG
jgi:hypothetical protein